MYDIIYNDPLVYLLVVALIIIILLVECYHLYVLIAIAVDDVILYDSFYLNVNLISDYI
jgi:hypothetical protein